MKTQTIRTNEMTPQPFLGRRANQTTHNPTGAVSLLPVATTCDQKEVTMKTQAIAPKTGIETSTPNQQPKGQTQMNRISFLIRKLANTAPKAALLAIIAVGSFVLSPMAFAGCSFSPSAVTLYATPGQSVSSNFTISGISRIGGVGSPDGSRQAEAASRIRTSLTMVLLKPYTRRAVGCRSNFPHRPLATSVSTYLLMPLRDRVRSCRRKSKIGLLPVLRR